MRADRGSSSSARVVARFAAFLVCFSVVMVPLQANPFTGPGSGTDGGTTRQVSPVRTSPADRGLVSRQADLRERLGEYLSSWKASGDSSVLWGILAVSALYGLLHALGPGHRKTVVFSLYLAREAPFWEPAATGILLALLHGGAALILLLALKGVSGTISGRADSIAVWLEGSAYAVLILVALALSIRTVWNLAAGRPRSPGGKASLATVLVTGAYPCPGAILVLILSLTLGITGVGAMAVLAMSLGMSVPIVAAGYLAWFGRTGVFLALKRNESILGRVSAGVELSGYLILLGFSVYVALPFLASLVRLA